MRAGDDPTGLLTGKGIDPRGVLVLRHPPTEPRLNEVMPWLAAEKPDVFNAYQQTQGEKLERSMTRAKYVASFLGREPGQGFVRRSLHHRRVAPFDLR